MKGVTPVNSSTLWSFPGTLGQQGLGQCSSLFSSPFSAVEQASFLFLQKWVRRETNCSKLYKQRAPLSTHWAYQGARLSVSPAVVTEVGTGKVQRAQDVLYPRKFHIFSISVSLAGFQSPVILPCQNSGERFAGRNQAVFLFLEGIRYSQ